MSEQAATPFIAYEPTFTLRIADDPHRLPASEEEARARAREGVGLFKSRSFKTSREAWWDRLAKATTPEEKLGCARMIDALAFAHGLHEHELGAKLATENRAKPIVSNPEDVAALEERALARWR